MGLDIAWTAGDKSGGFRTGSYSGYNNWRSDLCYAMHGVSPSTVWNSVEEWEGKPFIGLIHFSDCEGDIGRTKAIKLAKDFSENREKFCEYFSDDSDLWRRESAIRVYDSFAEAFSEVAENGGKVTFC